MSTGQELPERILVADDDGRHAIEVAAHLGGLGYIAVGPVGDGEAAIDLCRKAVPDMALLDIRMPRMDGLEAAEVIFSELAVPVIIISGHADTELLDLARRTGVFGYLVKPVTQEQLNAGLRVGWGRFMDHASQDAKIHELRQKLEDRRIIEQAKWMLVKTKGITEPEAMRAIQKHARETRVKLHEVAKSVLDSAWLMDDEPPAPPTPPTPTAPPAD